MFLLTACTGTGGAETTPPVTQPSAAPTGVASEEPAPPDQPGRYVLIMDGSGSMKAADAGSGMTRLAASQAAARKFVDALPEGSQISLVTYGDKTPESAPRGPGCFDVSLKQPMGGDRNKINTDISALKAAGWTPIAKSLETAAEQSDGQPLNIVLLSDGEDSCSPPDPCAKAEELASRQPHLTISTVGLKASSQQLSCIAEKGRGVYVTADNAGQLARRLEVLRNPGAAAKLLSAQGTEKIPVGTKASEVRTLAAGFPDVPANRKASVDWRGYRWEFNDKGLLETITLLEGSTIDGLRNGDPASALSILGSELKTEDAQGAKVRYYVADERIGTAWKITVRDDKVASIALSAAMPKATCPPSGDDVKRVSGDPTTEVLKVTCTPDQRWAVAAAKFQGNKVSGWMLLKPEGVNWAKVQMVTTHADCEKFPDGIPMDEVDRMMGGFCQAAKVSKELKVAAIAPTGIGPLKIGIPAEDLVKMGAAARTKPDVCKQGYHGTGNLPKDVNLEFGEGKFLAVEVTNAELKTEKGAYVGLAQAELEKLYPGQLQPVEHNGRKGLAWVDGQQMVEFALDGGKVKAIYVSAQDKPFTESCPRG